MNLDWIFETVSFIGISHGFNIHLENDFYLDRITADMISNVLILSICGNEKKTCKPSIPGLGYNNLTFSNRHKATKNI